MSLVTFCLSQCLYNIELLINKLLKRSMYNILGMDMGSGRFFDIYTDYKEIFVWACRKNNKFINDIYYKTYMNFDVRYKESVCHS